MAPRRLGVAGLVVVMQWAVTAELPARGGSLRARSCVAGRDAAVGQRHEGGMRMLHTGLGRAPSVLRLRGGAKSISTKPRTWKQQSKHHAEMRKSSIRKKRGKNPQEATWTKEARANIRTVADARRLREMAENEERKLRLKEERGTDFNHQLRLEYLRANEEADRRREERYQTLEDISDSVEREIEELRQKRGESRGLTVPEWRGEHPSYWKEVEKEVANEREDLSNPEKVCMYVRMYSSPEKVFMTVCMYAHMYEVCMTVYYVCMYVCMYVCRYVCMHACMHACMHECTYVLFTWEFCVNLFLFYFPCDYIEKWSGTDSRLLKWLKDVIIRMYACMNICTYMYCLDPCSSLPLLCPSACQPLDSNVTMPNRSRFAAVQTRARLHCGISQGGLL